MRSFFYSLILLIAAAPAWGQVQWELLPGPDGTWAIQCIEVDSAGGVVYAGSPSGGGLFRSSDGGLTWQNKSNGLPAQTTVSDIAASPAGVFAIAGNMYKSTDGGDSWQEIAGGPAGMTNLHVTQGGTIFAGSELSAGGQGIYKSTDGGTTWELSANGIPSYVIFFTYYRGISGITSDASGNLYCSVNSGSASTETGVYVSTDGGANWTRSVAGLLAHTSINSVTMGPGGRLYVGARHRVYTSTDNGANWSAADSIPVANSTFINGFAFNGSGEVFVATSAGLFRGAAGGTGWTKLGDGTLPGNLADIAYEAAGGTVLTGGLDIWGIGGGCFRSTDNGDSWENANAGMNNALVLGLTVTPWGHIYTGLGRGRIEYSTDGGSTFTRVSVPYTGISSQASVVAIRGNTAGGLVAGTAEGIYTSEDSGATWSKTSTASTKTFNTDPSGNFYAATTGGVLKSTDNGLTWNGMGGGGNSNTVFHTASGTVLSGTYNSGIDRTTDGGSTWTNSGTSLFGNITIGYFIQLPNNAIYVHTLGGIFISTDDGASWSAVAGTPVGQQYRTLANAGGTMLLGTTLDGLFLSDDGATTWQNHASGLMYRTISYFALAPDGRLYESGGVGVYRSRNPILTDVVMESAVVPTGYALSQVYPNPFNPSTAVRFTLPVRSEVNVSVFNTLGVKVATLVNGKLEPGEFRTEWNAAGMPSGVYMLMIRATAPDGRSGGFTDIRKMVLLK